MPPVASLDPIAVKPQRRAMHELGLMEEIVRTVQETLERNGSPTLRRILLRVGPLSGACPEPLAFAFEALRSTYPALREAELRIETPAVRCYCASCRRTFEAAPATYACPDCGCVSRDIRSGRELEIAALEVD